MDQKFTAHCRFFSLIPCFAALQVTSTAIRVLHRHLFRCSDPFHQRFCVYAVSVRLQEVSKKEVKCRPVGELPATFSYSSPTSFSLQKLHHALRRYSCGLLHLSRMEDCLQNQVGRTLGDGSRKRGSYLRLPGRKERGC